MKNIILVVFALVYTSGFSQENLNKYKYIIIPKKFDGFKTPNQYQTSTLLKYAFGEKGFLAIYDDVLPEDLFKNRCLGLTAQLNDESAMFSTKVSIALRDCAGQEVFVSLLAKNKIKAYDEAYKAAIFESMASFDNLDYRYTPVETASEPITVSFKNDVKTLDNDAAVTSAEVKGILVESAGGKPKNSREGVRQIATETEQSYSNRTPVESSIKQSSKQMAAVQNRDTVVLYAQPIANGYQLVDGTPKVVMKLMKSSTENVYIANAEGKSGMVFKNEAAWVFEYYVNDQLVRDELHIKF